MPLYRFGPTTRLLDIHFPGKTGPTGKPPPAPTYDINLTLAGFGDADLEGTLFLALTTGAAPAENTVTTAPSSGRPFVGTLSLKKVQGSPTALIIQRNVGQVNLLNFLNPAPGQGVAAWGFFDATDTHNVRSFMPPPADYLQPLSGPNLGTPPAPILNGDLLDTRPFDLRGVFAQQPPPAYVWAVIGITIDFTNPLKFPGAMAVSGFSGGPSPPVPLI